MPSESTTQEQHLNFTPASSPCRSRSLPSFLPASRSSSGEMNASCEVEVCVLRNTTYDASLQEACKISLALQTQLGISNKHLLFLPPCHYISPSSRDSATTKLFFFLSKAKSLCITHTIIHVHQESLVSRVKHV